MQNDAPSSESVRLFHPDGATAVPQPDGTVTISLPGGYGVVVDPPLTELWQNANGKTMAELATNLPPLNDWQEAIYALRTANLLLPAAPQKAIQPPLPEHPPLVSVIILTKNGRHHLEECLPSLANQSYPNIEIIVIDDASTDDTAVYLQTHFPHAQQIPLPNGPNFAAGCNLGAAHAQGQYLFFLNNDTRLDPNCIRHLVAAHAQDPQTAGVAAMLRLHSHPPFINGLGTQVRCMGFGYDIGLGQLDVGQFANWEDVPALCFGAALVTREAWLAVGPLDERYQFYYEDTDWSIRARLAGYRLRAAPNALVFHKFSASMNEKAASFKIRLASRNRRWFAAKNLPLTAVPLQLGLYTLDDATRLGQAIKQRNWPLAGAVVQGWAQSLWGLPAVFRARRQIKRLHAVSLQSKKQPLPPIPFHQHPILTSGHIANLYKPFLQKQDAMTIQTHTLLIICPDAVHSSMGGVGIRYWELAHQLADNAQVTLAIPNKTDLTAEQFQLVQYEEGHEETLRPFAQQADIILLSGFTAYHHPFLKQLPASKIIDLYDPMILENLERFSTRPMAERQGLHQVGVATFNDLFQMGDFFICASEKQRDYWLGALTAANRVNPAVYDADPTLRQLIDLVPFGIPAKPPTPTQPVLKGVRPGIAPTDKVILWGGGLWDWLDPLTVIEAMPDVLTAVPQARLFFLGIRHPNPAVPPSRMAQQAVALAEQMGLRDTAVFFNDWTPYEERVNYLCEADIGVSLHGDHIETRFAVRTRLMDYLWAELPMVVGGGDVLSDLVRQHGLGVVVAAGDKTAVTDALITLLQNPVDPAAFEAVKRPFYWPEVAKPLQNYVKRPWRNVDGGGAGETAVMPNSIMRLPQKAWQTLRQRGISGLNQEIKNYLRWLQNQ
ncbi:MAG: glycosyltransferase [Candidatus Promineifilaceae bacterium]